MQFCIHTHTVLTSSSSPFALLWVFTSQLTMISSCVRGDRSIFPESVSIIFIHLPLPDDVPKMMLLPLVCSVLCECALCPVSQCQLSLRQPVQRNLRRQEDLSRTTSPQTPLPSPLKPRTPIDPLLLFQGERGWALWPQQLRPAVSNEAGRLQCWFAGLQCMVTVQVCVVADA